MLRSVVQPAIHLRLPATRASIEVARQALLDFVVPLALGTRVVFDLELVLEEVLMNIAVHAYAHLDDDTAADREVALTLAATATHVTMIFDDAGIAFDPTTVTLPPPAASLSASEPGGLGLRLLKRRADELCYARTNGRNVLTVSIATA